MILIDKNQKHWLTSGKFDFKLNAKHSKSNPLELWLKLNSLSMHEYRNDIRLPGYYRMFVRDFERKQKHLFFNKEELNKAMCKKLKKELVLKFLRTKLIFF